jgi:hypothetical protein
MPDNYTGNFVEKLEPHLAADDDATTAAKLNLLVNRINDVKENKGYLLRPYLSREAFSSIFDYYLDIQKDLDMKKLVYGKTPIIDADITLNIKSFVLRIPHITPSSNMDLIFTKQLSSNKLSKDQILSRRTTSHDLKSASNKVSIEVGQLTLPQYLCQLTLPQYLCVGFKFTEEASYTTNNSKFVMWRDANNFIKSFQAKLNGDLFPLTAMQICNAAGFINNDSFEETFRTAYKLSGRNVFPFDKEEYRNIYPIILMDLSKRNERGAQTSNTVHLHVEQTIAANNSFTMFVTLFSDKTYQLDYTKSTIKVE